MVFKKIGNWIHKNLRPSALLESKIVLYALVVIAILNLYMYAMDDNLVYAAIMLIVGFLSSFFNKNMIIILFTAIAVTNIINFVSKTKQQIEGFTTDLSQINELMGHLTGDNSNTSSTKATVGDSEEVTVDVSENIEIDVQDELNTDPNVRDKVIDDMVKKLNISGQLSMIEGKLKMLDDKKVMEIKSQCDLALKNIDKIANLEQRESMKKFLEVQNKLIDQLANLGPLVHEFRQVSDSFPN